MPAKANARGSCGGARRAGNGRAARTDADEAMEDSQAEVNDVSAVLSSPAAAAGESAGPPKSAGPPPVLPPAGPPELRAKSAGPPDGLLERRLAKERTEKEKQSRRRK